MLGVILQELQYCYRFIKGYAVPLLLIAFVLIIMVLLYNKSPVLYQFPHRAINAFVYYGVLPLIFGCIILRCHPFKLGLGLGNYKFWLPATILYLMIALPLTYLGTNFHGMQQYYLKSNFDWVNYVGYMLLYMLGWEFLLRGYFLFGLKKYFHEGAILIQIIPFTLLHIGKPDIEVLSCIISGVIWGYICYRGNSFWPAFIMHIVINLFNQFLIQSL